MENIIIYTSDTCGYCSEAKEYLDSKGLKYEERNIANPEYRKELISMGIKTVPVLMIGEKKVVGFDKQKIDDLFGVSFT